MQLKRGKYGWMLSGAAALMLLGACGDGKTASPQAESLEDASKQELVSALEERDRLLAIVKEISETMEEIKRLEGALTVGDANPDERARRQRLPAEIAVVKRRLAERRRQLAELEEQLKNSTLYTDDLQAIVATMRRQIDLQSTEINSLQPRLLSAGERIDSLSSAVDSLNQSVGQLTEQKASAVEMSERLSNEMNTCYYVVAPKSVLKEHKIIETPFLRRTKLLNGDFDHTLFTEADRRTLSEITLGEKKARPLTSHPDGSYRIERVGGVYKFVITDATAFWGVSNYLVLQEE